MYMEENRTRDRGSRTKSFVKRKEYNKGFRVIIERLVVVPHRNAATVDQDVNAAKHLQSCFALSFQGLQL
jgi:hypothetical protein